MTDAPSHIVYLLGGRPSGESLVAMCSEWGRQIQWDCRQSLVTTCANYDQFSGDTYHVTEERGTIGPPLRGYGNLGRWNQSVVQVAREEGLLRGSDVVLVRCTGEEMGELRGLVNKVKETRVDIMQAILEGLRALVTGAG